MEERKITLVESEKDLDYDEIDKVNLYRKISEDPDKYFTITLQALMDYMDMYEEDANARIDLIWQHLFQAQSIYMVAFNDDNKDT